jgi:hypothetical protein
VPSFDHQNRTCFYHSLYQNATNRLRFRPEAGRWLPTIASMALHYGSAVGTRAGFEHTQPVPAPTSCRDSEKRRPLSMFRHAPTGHKAERCEGGTNYLDRQNPWISIRGFPQYPTAQRNPPTCVTSMLPDLKCNPRMKKKAKNIYASKLAQQRWAKIPVSERSNFVPRSGGRPRKYPECPRYGSRYGSHRFSPRTGRCPCGFTRPSK